MELWVMSLNMQPVSTGTNDASQMKVPEVCVCVCVDSIVPAAVVMGWTSFTRMFVSFYRRRLLLVTPPRTRARWLSSMLTWRERISSDSSTFDDSAPSLHFHVLRRWLPLSHTLTHSHSHTLTLFLSTSSLSRLSFAVWRNTASAFQLVLAVLPPSPLSRRSFLHLHHVWMLVGFRPPQTHLYARGLAVFNQSRGFSSASACFCGTSPAGRPLRLHFALLSSLSGLPP